jgi:hypothetical protein
MVRATAKCLLETADLNVSQADPEHQLMSRDYPEDMDSAIENAVPPLVGGRFTEPEFLRAFEDLTFPGDDFHHLEHLHLAWLYLQQAETEQATTRMEESILRFAIFHQSAEKFHKTMTSFWVCLVAAALRDSPGLSFEHLVENHPELLDQRLPYQYYSEQVLASPEARQRRLDPDLTPLP